MEINIPEIVDEVTEAFWRYEQALLDNDVDLLNQIFWNSEHTIRYGFAERLYGHAAIAGYRAAPRSTPLVREVTKLVVTTFGRDFGTANCETARANGGIKSRQSHSWVRMEDGWRIAAAHVSELTE